MTHEIALSKGTERIVIDKYGSDGYVLDNIDWDTISVDMYTYQMPYQVGSAVSGVSYGSRQPVITGYVIAVNAPSEKYGSWEEFYSKSVEEIEKKKRELSSFLSPEDDIKLYAHGYFLRTKPAGVVQFGSEEKTNNEVFCKFQITMYGYGGLFESENETSLFSYTEGRFRFPLIIPEEKGMIFGIMYTHDYLTINNDGDLDSGCTIIMRAKGASVVNPLFMNVQTREYMRIIYKIEDGDYILINTNSNDEEVTYHGADGEKNIIANIEPGSSFIKIKKGIYDYNYRVDSGNKDMLDVSVQWNKKMFNLAGM